MLIANDADVNATHGNGGTALMLAIMFGRNNMIDILLDNGADISIRDKRGLGVLDIAYQQRNMMAIEML